MDINPSSHQIPIDSHHNDKKQNKVHQHAKSTHLSTHHTQSSLPPLTIGFIYFHALGDNILTFDSLYAIKHIYPCRLIVFGNALFQKLLKYCDFVDEVIDIDNDIASHIDIIDSYNLDYAILPKCTKAYLAPLSQSNIKQILTPLKIPALLHPKCKTLSIFSFLAHRNASMRDKPFYLVREIDKKRFDSKITSLDFSQARIQTSQALKDTINQFLAQNLSSPSSEQKSPCNTHCPNHSTAEWGGGQMMIQPTYLILINPFSVTASHSLSLNGFLRLIRHITEFPSCVPLVITYPKVKEEFMQALCDFKSSQDPNNALDKLLVFHNDDDVLTLAELTSRTSCIISPSTGIIHLGSHFHIPTIGLYSPSDARDWATRDRRYIFIPKPLQEINPDEENQVIAKTLETFSTLLPTLKPYTPPHTKG